MTNTLFHSHAVPILPMQERTERPSGEAAGPRPTPPASKDARKRRNKAQRQARKANR